MLGMTPQSRWADAQRDVLRMPEIMERIRRHWNRDYSPNTRDVIRRGTLRQFVGAGLVVFNEDDPTRPANSSNNNYRIGPEAFEVVRQFGTDGFAPALSEYLVKYPGMRSERSTHTVRLASLRLTSFKTFHDENLELLPVTVLIGRNGAGKSNALDGLEVLARLAGGDDLVDALDGRRREGGAVRGGSAGCPPHGQDTFTVGCDVELVNPDVFADVARYRYSVTVAVRPEFQILEESLHGPVQALKSGKWTHGPIFASKANSSEGTGIAVAIHTGKRGGNETKNFRDGRVVLAQIPLAVPGANRAQRSVLLGVDAVLTALRGVFHLDPIPHLMRSFTPARDNDMKRTGENVSAVLRRLELVDRGAFERITEAVSQISDGLMSKIAFAHSDLGDVMLALVERDYGGVPQQTPAREASDGLLRFLAIATALLSPKDDLDVDASTAMIAAADGEQSRNVGVLIVIEELENGLHSSQARRVLDLVRESAADPGASVLVTTHSPAILDAAEGGLSDAVTVCHRDPATGHSVLTPLMDVPGYTRAVTETSLGKAITLGRIGGPVAVSSDPDYSEFERLIGLR